jgi:CRP-like cAMP-binding protein
VLNSFVDGMLRSLKRNELAVWLILYRDTRDGVACTSQADIARRAGTSKRTVIRALGRLQKLGLVELLRRGTMHGLPSSYRVHPLIRNE